MPVDSDEPFDMAEHELHGDEDLLALLVGAVSTEDDNDDDNNEKVRGEALDDAAAAMMMEQGEELLDSLMLRMASTYGADSTGAAPMTTTNKSNQNNEDEHKSRTATARTNGMKSSSIKSSKTKNKSNKSAGQRIFETKKTQQPAHDEPEPEIEQRDTNDELLPFFSNNGSAIADTLDPIIIPPPSLGNKNAGGATIVPGTSKSRTTTPTRVRKSYSGNLDNPASSSPPPVEEEYKLDYTMGYTSEGIVPQDVLVLKSKSKTEQDGAANPAATAGGAAARSRTPRKSTTNAKTAEADQGKSSIPNHQSTSNSKHTEKERNKDPRLVSKPKRISDRDNSRSGTPSRRSAPRDRSPTKQRGGGEQNHPSIHRSHSSPHKTRTEDRSSDRSSDIPSSDDPGPIPKPKTIEKRTSSAPGNIKPVNTQEGTTTRKPGRKTTYVVKPVSKRGDVNNLKKSIKDSLPFSRESEGDKLTSSTNKKKSNMSVGKLFKTLSWGASATASRDQEELKNVLTEDEKPASGHQANTKPSTTTSALAPPIESQHSPTKSDSSKNLRHNHQAPSPPASSASKSKQKLEHQDDNKSTKKNGRPSSQGRGNALRSLQRAKSYEKPQDDHCPAKPDSSQRHRRNHQAPSPPPSSASKPKLEHQDNNKSTKKNRRPSSRGRGNALRSLQRAKSSEKPQEKYKNENKPVDLDEEEEDNFYDDQTEWASVEEDETLLDETMETSTYSMYTLEWKLWEFGDFLTNAPANLMSSYFSMFEKPSAPPSRPSRQMGRSRSTPSDIRKSPKKKGSSREARDADEYAEDDSGFVERRGVSSREIVPVTSLCSCNEDYDPGEDVLQMSLRKTPSKDERKAFRHRRKPSYSQPLKSKSFSSPYRRSRKQHAGAIRSGKTWDGGSSKPIHLGHSRTSSSSTLDDVATAASYSVTLNTNQIISYHPEDNGLVDLIADCVAGPEPRGHYHD